jgi:LemA protein
MKQLLWIVLGVVVFAFIWGVSTYNGLVTKQEALKAAWSQVENVYQRRADLIPNLVETVKGSANFEKSTLTAVVEARAKATSTTMDSSVLNDPAKFKQFESAQGVLGNALSRLMVIVERYPDLKSSTNFRDLQVQLEGTENRITVERRSFNEVAQTYNTSIRRFPTSIIASMGGFGVRPYFEAEPGAQKAPKVNFQ